MPKYSGDVTLPDGRQFHAVVCFSQQEWDTGASDMLYAKIYDMEGNEVDADIQNEELEWPIDSDSKNYLWSVVVDLLLENNLEDEEDYGY
jgi:hypothetical protein